MAVSPSVVPAIVLLPSEMEGGAPQSITTIGRIRIDINTELALVYIGLGTDGGGHSQWLDSTKSSGISDNMIDLAGRLAKLCRN